MPEGNEVHRWAERHTAAFAGRKLNVLPGPNQRFREAHLIDGVEFVRVHAVGKHLGYEFANGLFLHVHLGRFGDWTEGLGPLPEPKGALRVILERRGRKPGREGQDAAEGWPLPDRRRHATVPFRKVSTGRNSAGRRTAASTTRQNGRRCWSASARTPWRRAEGATTIPSRRSRPSSLARPPSASC